MKAPPGCVTGFATVVCSYSVRVCAHASRRCEVCLTFPKSAWHFLTHFSHLFSFPCSRNVLFFLLLFFPPRHQRSSRSLHAWHGLVSPLSLLLFPFAWGDTSHRLVFFFLFLYLSVGVSVGVGVYM